MNNLDLLKAIGDIDDKYLIEENDIKETNRIEANKKVNIMKKLKLRYILVPVCIIVIAIIVFFTSKAIVSKPDTSISKNDKWIIKEVRRNSNATSTDVADIAVVPKWDDKSVSEQYYEFEYNNNRYSSRKTKISHDDILQNIGNAKLTGYDSYTDMTYTKKAELYSIKNISEECAIAVQFENDNDYYVYVNSYYKPETLGQFMEDINLKNITSFGTIYYDYWDTEYNKIEFYNVDNDIIWQMLFEDTSLENVYSDKEAGKYVSERFASEIGISVDIPILGYENISITLTDKGYLMTNILDTGKAFYIGENKVNEFLNYIIDNYEGYKIVYINDDEQENTNTNNSNEDSIVMYDRTTNETTNVSNVTKNLVENNDNNTSSYNPMKE